MFNLFSVKIMKSIRKDMFGSVCRVKRASNEQAVQNGLALTPSQIMKMSERGIPVTTQNLDGMFYDGDTRPSWDVPLDQQRGVDVATMWQKRKDLAKRLRENYSNIPNEA